MLFDTRDTMRLSSIPILPYIRLWESRTLPTDRVRVELLFVRPSHQTSSDVRPSQASRPPALTRPGPERQVDMRIALRSGGIRCGECDPSPGRMAQHGRPSLRSHSSATAGRCDVDRGSRRNLNSPTKGRWMDGRWIKITGITSAAEPQPAVRPGLSQLVRCKGEHGMFWGGVNHSRGAGVFSFKFLRQHR
jgi:hypothetical protein